MKIKVVRNVYLVCKQDGSLELQPGRDHLHTPKANERDDEIKELLDLPGVIEVFYLKHEAGSREIDDNVLGGLI